MFTRRETATLLAALRHWREEFAPLSRAVMRPYFRSVGCEQVTPLNRREISRLTTRLTKHLRSLDA
jgi:hypothetical protein